MNQHSKSARILELYQMFIAGKVVNKREMAERYGVDLRSIQRDIDSIRDFLSDQMAQNGVVQSIAYDAKEKGYKLVTQEATKLSGGEMLTISKILLESKAFHKDDVEDILKRIMSLSDNSKDKRLTQQYIANELYNYVNPAHPTINTDIVWEIEKAISDQRIVRIFYNRLKGQELVERRIWPVGILFSEFYFYLMGINPDKKENFEKKDDPYPTIYRIDRIHKIKVLDEHFSIPSRDRFKEGEYKNRVQYMFGGEIQNITFKYFGKSIEAVLDKLPMAKAEEESDGVYTVRAEVFGKGILMWLLSQGSNVQVISPESLRTAWINEAKQIVEREGTILW